MVIVVASDKLYKHCATGTCAANINEAAYTVSDVRGCIRIHNLHIVEVGQDALNRIPATASSLNTRQSPDVAVGQMRPASDCSPVPATSKLQKPQELQRLPLQPLWKSLIHELMSAHLEQFKNFTFSMKGNLPTSIGEHVKLEYRRFVLVQSMNSQRSYIAPLDFFYAFANLLFDLLWSFAVSFVKCFCKYNRNRHISPQKSI